jgi:DNA-binding response OmpR family regulator
VLRRSAPRQPRPVLTAGPVRIDLRDRTVTIDERSVELSAMEYRLLCHLADEPTRVLTKVNFEYRREASERGIQGLGRDW